MPLNEILVLSICVAIIIIVVISIIITKKISNYLNSKTLNIKLNRISSILSDIVDSSVKSTHQRYVETQKKSSTFCKENQLNALNLAKENILKTMPKEVFDFLKTTYPSLNIYLELQIEKAVYEHKNIILESDIDES